MTTTKQYTTRNLTAAESNKLMSSLVLALGGKTVLVNSVLRVIADQGLGIFAAEEVQDKLEDMGWTPEEAAMMRRIDPAVRARVLNLL